MKKIRCFFAAIALLATLSGFSIQGLASASLANAAFSHHVSSTNASFVAGKATGPIALKIYGICPLGGEVDC